MKPDPDMKKMQLLMSRLSQKEKLALTYGMMLMGLRISVKDLKVTGKKGAAKVEVLMEFRQPPRSSKRGTVARQRAKKRLGRRRSPRAI